MASTIVSYLGDGSTTLFTIGFPYLSPSHVVVTLDGVATTAFTFPTSASIKFTAAPTAGQAIYIHRVTPQTPLVDFVDGSTLTEALLDTATNQAIYIAQEAFDGVATSQALADAVTAATVGGNLASTKASEAYASKLAAANSAINAQNSATAAAGSASSLASKLVSVKDFGAVGDGVTDDTSKIQAAIVAIQGTGGRLFFPKGTYKVSSTLNITGSLLLEGESRYGTSLTWTSKTLNVVNISSDTQITMERLTFSGPISATGGAIITLSGSATQNLFSTFRDCTFSKGYNHINTTNAADWFIENCVFNNYVNAGVFVSNAYKPDAGDSYIGGCTFSAIGADSIGIYQVSSGGLKVEGNKIIGGLVGYKLQLSLAVAPSTIDLIIVGNSIENQTGAGVQLQRDSGTLTFGNVVITGNQISNTPIGITSDSNAGWLSRLVISGNQITLPAVNGSCISLGSPSSFIIDGNEFYGQSGTTVGVAIGVGATAGRLGVNAYNNLTTPISNGAGTAVNITQVTQKASSSVTTSLLVIEPLYYGSVWVTFPVAFNVVPKVMTTTTSTGLSVLASGITVSGFNAIGWALANTTTVPFDYVAFADY